MTLKEHISLVKYYNDWRRGNGIKQPDPKELGIAIDEVIKAAKAWDNHINPKVKKWIPNNFSNDITDIQERIKKEELK